MKEYLVEQYNPSDQEYTITELFIEIGSVVKKGDIIMSLESSKADMEVESEESGYFYSTLNIGDIVKVGQVLYMINDSKIENFELHKGKEKNNDNIVISRKAKALIDANNINILDIGKSAITELDVLNFIEQCKANVQLTENDLKEFKHDETIIILGGKGGGKMITDALYNNMQFKNILILDDNISIGTNVGDAIVIGPFSYTKKLIEFGYKNFVIGFGVLTNRENRLKLYEKLKSEGASFPNIIHPKANIEKSVLLGEGNVFLAGSNIGSFVKIGNLNYFNNNCLISHDCEILDNSHFAPACVLGSSILIENNCLIGMNTTLYYGISIGSKSVINNGIILNKSIDKNSIIDANR
jgi:sugar O-acyltransferase (sialic acid O-acetyltransferase NeuD family)